MKTLTNLLTVTLLLAGTLLLPVSVGADHLWKLEVSTPRSVTNDSRVTLDYTVLSTDNSEAVDLSLSVNGGSPVDTDDTDVGGGSGHLIADLPGDGTYTLTVNAVPAHDEPIVRTRTVTLDTTAPSAPEYFGFTRTDNRYVVSFAAGDDNTERIHLFSSNSPSFTADDSTRVGSVSASGERQQIAYTALDSDRRFHAVVAVDSAGNVSNASGDPETTVLIIEETVPAPGTATPGTGTPGTVTPATTTPGGVTAADDDEDVLGVTDVDEDVDEDGNPLPGTDADAGDEDGEVAGVATDTARDYIWWLLALALALAAFLYYRRYGLSLPNKNSQA